MKFKQLKARIRSLSQWIPFTWNTFVWGILVWIAVKILYQPINKENAMDAQLPFVRLMGEFVAWFILGIVGLSVLSTVSTWLYFLWMYRNKKSALQVHFYTEEKNNRKKQFLEATLPYVLRPVLGFIKGRLVYDDGQLTEKFGLLSARLKKNSLLRDAIVGKSRIELPDIKEYQIKGSILFFEDLLRIISLPVQQKMGGTFYQAPNYLPEAQSDAAPKKTDDMDIRIEQLRKVEGEYLNYKDFESGDDVRRIVWKVYAKNRDLVVRIPERMEPYASHLYFYASFYNSIGNGIFGNDYYDEMLNFYKSNVWSIYQALEKKEWQIKYVPDQEFHLNHQSGDHERDERIISNSEWQKDLSTRSYFSAQKGTVLVISSLTDTKELAQLLDECNHSVQIIYVPLSKIFRQYAALNWLKRIFFVPSPDRMSKLKSTWLFSPLRRQVLKNEKEIELLLK